MTWVLWLAVGACAYACVRLAYMGSWVLLRAWMSFLLALLYVTEAYIRWKYVRLDVEHMIAFWARRKRAGDYDRMQLVLKGVHGSESVNAYITRKVKEKNKEYGYQ